MPFLSTFLLPPLTSIQRRGEWRRRSAKLDFSYGTGAGKLSCCTPILTQCSKRKKWRVRGYRHSINQLQTSLTPSLPSKVFCMRFAHCTESPHWIQLGAAVRAEFLALHAVVRPCIINCILVMWTQPCAGATVQKYQCGCGLAGGEDALPDIVN